MVFESLIQASTTTKAADDTLTATRARYYITNQHARNRSRFGVQEGGGTQDSGIFPQLAKND